MPETRRYGARQGAAGVVIYERSSINEIGESVYGTCAYIGHMKRGPAGIPVLVESRSQYTDFFGDPQDPFWHMFADADHLLPDTIDDYFSTGGGSGSVFVCRLQLADARPAERVFKNRLGADALKITAANEGRWGGAENALPETPVVVATKRTFTVYAPGVLGDEFVGAKATFTNSAKEYTILANTKAEPNSGEAVFTVGAQFDLTADGVTGPTALTGTAAYTQFTGLAGTIDFPALVDLTGTVQINDQVVTGNGTLFTTELAVGESIYHNGQVRVIESITSDTTLTVKEAFSSNATGATIQTDNLIVTGTTTAFDTELSVGDELYVDINGALQGRQVAAINSATELILTAGFTTSVTGAVGQKMNLIITGTDSSFTTEVQPGDFIIDPYRAGETVRVAEVTDGTTIVIDGQFSSDFSGFQLTKQRQQVEITLAADPTKGLAVKIGKGRRYPETHFSLTVYFNNRLVFDLDDCSLDPRDERFVDDMVDDYNLGYSFDSQDYHLWIRAESQWLSEYTTNPDTDVRPTNGAGKVLEVTESHLYTVADLDYADLVGQELYPDPYGQPRGYVMITEAAAPLTLQGTVSSSGVAVTGVSTQFLSELSVGDFLYDPATDSVREVSAISSDTVLTLRSPFDSDMSALTVATRSGYLIADIAYDVASMTTVGYYFEVSHAQRLKRGYDGDVGAISPANFARFSNESLDLLGKAVYRRNMGLVRMATPGENGVAVQKAMLNYASLRAFEYRGEIPSHISTPAAAEAFVQQQVGRSDFLTIAFPSYGSVANPMGAGYRRISLIGGIMGGESRRAVANRSYANIYAGVNAPLPMLLSVPVTIRPDDEAILNRTGIQQIVFLDGRYVVWGGRAPSVSDTYKFIHIRRIQSHLTRVLLDATVLAEVMFEPNQPGVMDEVVLALERLFREEYRKGTLTKYLPFSQATQIQSETQQYSAASREEMNASIVSILNGKLSITALYVPTGIVEVLEIATGPQILVEQYGNFTS